MFLSNGVATNSRKSKRKITKVVRSTVAPQPIDLFPTQHQCPQQNLVSKSLRLDINGQSQRQPEKMAMPFLSFTSLLTEDEDEDPFANIQEQTDQIDQIIKTHVDNLRCTLTDLCRRDYTVLLCAAEERMAKNVREKELELERMGRKNEELEERAAHFKTEAQVWQAKVKTMEQKMTSLRAALHEATLRRGSIDGGWRLGCAGCGEAQQEDAESSYVDPDRVDPVRLACTACGKRVATVMMWPCRHVCVCKRCDPVTKACPVCLSLKTISVEVCLP